MRSTLGIVWVIAALVAAVALACRWPIPSCDEGKVTVDSREIVLNIGRMELVDGGGFRVDGRTYASCTEWCAEQVGVREVISCTPPAGVARYDGGPVEYGVTCELDVVYCKRTVLVGRP